ncbi:MAG: hypothetical protein COB98_08170 [Flavobacteriaceae bacterium]|nr:MAG: hypothetical protein COB98_08170 [Flavobacteriaceae bacterium]
MDYKKKYTLLLLGLFFVSMVHSQFASVGEQYNRFDSTIKTFDHSKEPTDGSPYVFKEFNPAKISLLKEVCLVNFDAYSNKMEIDKQGRIYCLPTNNFNYDIHFINSKKTYQLFNYEVNKEMKPGFFLVLIKNNKRYLLKKERIRKFDAKKATNGYNASRPITFKRLKAIYYTCFENNKALKIPSKKKHFLLLFNQQKDRIATYMKQQKLNYKKEEDLLQIFKYYNRIN